MSQLYALKFDNMEVDTKLAKGYFKKINNTFCSIYNGKYTVKDYDNYTKDSWNNKIYLSSKYNGALNNDTLDLHMMANSLWQLAKKIEENGDLFCQLEHLLHKMPIDECKQLLQIVINKCMFWSSIFDKYTIGNGVTEANTRLLFLSRKDLPVHSLLHFSRVIDALCYTSNVIIMAHPDTAAISTLFTELCVQVGLKNRVLLDLYAVAQGPVMQKEAEGCYGIVTDTADVDSAVHAFIESSTKAPWKLSRILVQENVYEDFRSALQWKCSLKNGASTNQYYQNLKKFCTDIQVGGGKMFMLDYVGGGDLPSELHVVTIEAYRTSKELQTMMSKFTEKFVSLWASDAAQANEIAVSLPSSLTWINSYGVWNGPPQISNCIGSIREISDDEYEKNLECLSNEWLKLDLKKRQDAILGAVAKLLEDDRAFNVEGVRLLTLLRTQKLGFVEVHKDHMWIGIEEPMGLVYVEDTELFVNAIASIVHGNRVVLSRSFRRHSPLVMELRKAGVPIYLADNDKVFTSDYKLYKYKMIYSNFGTIFAN